MLPLIAVNVAGFTIVNWIVLAIIVLACIGIALAAARQFQIPIPPFVIQVFWICVVAFLAIVAIKFLVSLF